MNLLQKQWRFHVSPDKTSTVKLRPSPPLLKTNIVAPPYFSDITDEKSCNKSPSNFLKHTVCTVF